MYSFAVNPIKLELAITKSQDKSEESVLAEYIKLGGLIKENYVKPISEIDSVVVEIESIDAEIEEPRTIRSARKPKTTSK